jgi:predicted transcriptional regulator
MLLAPLTALTSAEGSDELTLQVTLSDIADGEQWYSDSTDLSMQVSVHNPSEGTLTLEYNPSCPVEISMLDSSGALLTSLREHRTCFEQSRAIDVLPHQTRTLDSFDWDWTNGADQLVGSDDITLQFDFDEGVMFEQTTIHFQRSPVTISDLTLEMNLPPPPGGRIAFQSGEPLYAHLSLLNTADQPVTITVEDGCRVIMQISTIAESLSARLTDIGCASGMTIPAGGSASLGWFDWDFTDQGEIVDSDEWNLAASLSGVVGLSASVQAVWETSEVQADTPLDLEISVVGDSGDDGIITAADTVQLSSQLVNDGDDIVELEFQNSCLAFVHVIAADGRVVFDDRISRSCEVAHSESKVDPGETFTVDERSWDFTDFYGCELDDGPHVLLVTTPEQLKTVEWRFDYQGLGEGAACRASMQDISGAHFSVDSMQVLDAGTTDERVSFELRFDTLDSLDIHWPQQCRLQFTLQKVGEQQAHRVWTEACDGAAGVVETVPANDPHFFGPYVVALDGLEAGSWTLDATTTGTPTFSAQWARTWNPPVEQSEEGQSDSGEATEESSGETSETPATSWLAEGSWQYVTTEVGGCWLLVDLAGDEHALAGTTISGWGAMPNLQGSYVVEQSSAADSACTTWASKIVVSEVMSERVVEPTVEDDSSEAATQVVTTPVPIAAPAIIATVAATGMIAILVGMVTKVEWIRMPATKYGMLLIGLVKRSKDKGGEYQRGRIVAYIELHSGIHFRALLAALSMSNGQLTHHLSVLVNDERIWRQKDGRKVRFYPASVNPHTPPEELPVPVLTPDPNSLQGRILQMLDIHENEILNLSQKELSVKLETSQQLVSYHLKSLEQWGLIEKEKVALRFRYRLTDRALLLLDSADFPSLGEEL